MNIMLKGFTRLLLLFFFISSNLQAKVDWRTTTFENKDHFLKYISACILEVNKELPIEQKVSDELVVATAVLESAWGTSRFALEGNNLYGIKTWTRTGPNMLPLENQGANFSVGANIAMIFMMAIEQEYEEIDFAVRAFQNTTGRIRYSSIPTVVATHGMTLGGGCEIALHADHIQASAETYIGLVEMGVGVIPGGGGTKEMAKRASDSYFSGDIQLPTLKERYLNIGMAKVATSAKEAIELDLLLKKRDKVTIGSNNLVTDAKAQAIVLANNGYTKPTPEKIKVLF